jgi:glycosyltransferase involved in cell wall biosynthesis
VTSIIIPAHNEATVIGRLLVQLVSRENPGEFDVIVVANGCSDETAAVAEAFGSGVRVLSIPVASKHAALIAGDEAAKDFPRIYLDADVELGGGDVRALAQALEAPGALAAAPRRELAMAGRPWLVRWYYDVWTRLPEVRQGLFGRGVIGVSELGHQRIAELPPVLADDLAASLAFAPAERIIVSAASVVVHPPRTFGDLMRRRVRAAVSVAQIENTQSGQDGAGRTSMSDLMAIAQENAGMPPRVMLFLAIAVLARLRARRAVRRGDFSTWLRDESSRQEG